MLLLCRGCLMKFPSSFRKHRAASDRQRLYRLVLECLEDRCLLSGGFTQVNLASDVPGLARIIESNLVNHWGMAWSATVPFLFAMNARRRYDVFDGLCQ